METIVLVYIPFPTGLLAACAGRRSMFISVWKVLLYGTIETVPGGFVVAVTPLLSAGNSGLRNRGSPDRTAWIRRRIHP
ncbi:hypothetical protein [Mycolicibacterium palauense]|uniref:hypothetical protein n=1 Tax=Mycolicibacterium palauense TaxID=2034511 RepID=UPI0011453805|nr:hypothetical protein [Mycolicibacterium palauense]